VWGGGIAGACDITYAIVANLQRGGTWERTLQSVASGWLGREAFSRGMATAGLGLASHFLIALIWAGLYFAASQRVKLLAEQPWVMGPLYGVAVYAVMNHVVVPLSAAPFVIPWRVTGLLVHMFLVGLPIAVAVKRFRVRD
jgi:hypothetical protein